MSDVDFGTYVVHALCTEIISKNLVHKQILNINSRPTGKGEN